MTKTVKFLKNRRNFMILPTMKVLYVCCVYIKITLTRHAVKAISNDKFVMANQRGLIFVASHNFKELVKPVYTSHSVTTYKL